MSVKEAALRAIRWFGYDLVHSSGKIPLCSVLNHLCRKGLRLRIVYDIGAFNGSWATALKNCLSTSPEFILFEPNESHLQELRATGFLTFTQLLGDENGEIAFYSRAETGDSIYREKTARFDSVAPVSMQMRRLDDLVAAENLPVADLIKIDVQGAELKVIRGARSALQNSQLIYLEMPILQYNSGAPSFEAVLGELLERDFLPYAVLENHRHSNVLVQVDMLLIHRQALETLFGVESSQAAKKFLQES